MFMSIDPGENVGFATFSATGGDLMRSVVKLQEFRRFYLQMTYDSVRKGDLDFITFIMEDFTLRQDLAIAQTGSNMPAPRCIGAVEQIDTMLGAKSKIVLVKAGNLRGSLKWAGFPEYANKPRTWHCPDDIAAYAHGVKYLIDQNLRKHPIFDA